MPVLYNENIENSRYISKISKISDIFENIAIFSIPAHWSLRILPSAFPRITNTEKITLSLGLLIDVLALRSGPNIAATRSHCHKQAATRSALSETGNKPVKSTTGFHHHTLFFRMLDYQRRTQKYCKSQTQYENSHNELVISC